MECSAAFILLFQDQTREELKRGIYFWSQMQLGNQADINVYQKWKDRLQVRILLRF